MGSYGIEIIVPPKQTTQIGRNTSLAIMERKNSVLGSLKNKLLGKSTSSKESSRDEQRMSSSRFWNDAATRDQPDKVRPTYADDDSLSAPPSYAAATASTSNSAMFALPRAQTNLSVMSSNSMADIPDNDLALLAEYDIHFLIDDSGSMTCGARDDTPLRPGEKTRWQQARDALMAVAATCVKYDADGIDLHFLNAEKETHWQRHMPGCHDLKQYRRTMESCKGIKNKETVAKIFDQISPWAATPTGKRIKEILNSYVDELKRNPSTKPMLLMVITDGCPNDDPAEAINGIVRRLRYECKADRRQVGIQFLQIGQNDEASKALQALDDDLDKEWDIVDTEPWRPENGARGLTQSKIFKLLLGAINNKYDRMQAQK